MKKFYLFLCMFMFSVSAHSFEIIGLGASTMACTGVDVSKGFLAKLQENLNRDGIQATVINAARDGDRTVYMYDRLLSLINPQTKLVIFASGSNDKSTIWVAEGSSKILSKLQEQNIPAVYIYSLISEEEAQEIATKYGAYLYGHAQDNIPRDNEYWQSDTGKTGRWALGHMTAKGCQAWANNMTPFVEKIIKERNIH